MREDLAQEIDEMLLGLQLLESGVDGHVDLDASLLEAGTEHPEESGRLGPAGGRHWNVGVPGKLERAQEALEGISEATGLLGVVVGGHPRLECGRVEALLALGEEAAELGDSLGWMGAELLLQDPEDRDRITERLGFADPVLDLTVGAVAHEGDQGEHEAEREAHHGAPAAALAPGDAIPGPLHERPGLDVVRQVA